MKHTEQYEPLHELINHLKGYGEEDSLYTWYEASALKELDDYEKAYKLYEEIENDFSEDLDFLEEYGYFLLEVGLRKKAIQMFTKLLKLNPKMGIFKCFFKIYNNDNKVKKDTIKKDRTSYLDEYRREYVWAISFQ